MRVNLLESPARLNQGYQLERALAYRQRQEQLVINPLYDLGKDYKRIYHDGEYLVGFPDDIVRVFNYFAKNNTYVIVGAQLGDEGKGRIVDNILDQLVNRVGLRKVYVTRYQGGSNAGHTVEVGDTKLKLHQIPSLGLFREDIQLMGIMDAGMNLNPDDLKIEHDYIKELAGKELKDILVISRYAVLNTDLDRAEEVLLDLLAGKESGSTSEGMRTSSAHYYQRTSLNYEDFLRDDWKEVLGKKYDELATQFKTFFDKDLAEINVPDYEKVASDDIAEQRGEQEKPTGERERPKRPIGSKKDFLERLGEVRNWLIENDLIKDTINIHWQALQEIENGIAGHVFEGAQSIGLHPWLGTIGIDRHTKDTTSTDTSPTGVLYATKVIRVDDIEYRIGTYKATYMSSVGKRKMKTIVPLDKKIRKLSNLLPNATKSENWAAWIREEADEFGTTTGRPRDICFLDIPFLAYNCYVGNINMLAATHLDIARDSEKIKVCTHYIDKKRRVITYHPGIEARDNVIPQYIELDGWDGMKVREAKSYEELPENAKKYLAFIQARVGIPIVFSTTGPKRENYIKVPEMHPRRPIYINLFDRAHQFTKPRQIIFPN